MKNLSSKTGFGLIEMLAVIAIMGILAGIVFMNVSSARERARIAQAQLTTKRLVDAITLMTHDTEEWPGHQPPDVVCTDRPAGCPDDNELCDDGCLFSLNSGFGGLTADDSFDPYYKWAGPYISEIPLDPWGNRYFFDTDYVLTEGSATTMVAVIGSYGPNGTGNNDYDNDDILQVLKRED